MFKFSVLFLVMTFSANAFAHNGGEKWLCLVEDVEDAQLTVSFDDVDSDSPLAKLFVPTSDTDGKNYMGECTRDLRAPRLDVTCNLPTSSDSSFDLTLYATAEPKVFASVTPISRGKKGKTTVLPCFQ
ncbi:MAG: hypothetical protein AABZ55_07345 [Bdellovibrionota bacterium]